MKCYWTTRSVPEFSGLSKREVTRLLVATRWRPFAHWQFLLLVAIHFAVEVLAIMWLSMAIRSFSWVSLVTITLVLTLFGVGGVLLWNVKLYFQRPYIQRILSRQARELSKEH
jgi:hypothetical protein